MTQVSINNPAGISGLQRNYYSVNASLARRSSTYSGTPISSTNSADRDAWLKGLALPIKMFNFWGSSIGFNQYTNVNYKYTGKPYVEGAYNSLDATCDGNGGLNDFYWTNSIVVNKHVSFGVKASYIGGSINQNTTIDNPSSSTTLVTKQQDYYSGFKLEYGAIFSTNLGRKMEVSPGTIFSPEVQLNAERTLNILENNVAIIADKFISNRTEYIPLSYGAGITVVHNKRTTVSADYKYEYWGDLNVVNNGWRYVNSDRFTAGIQHAWFAKAWGGQVYEKRFLQAGVISNRSYLQVKGQQISGLAFTFGYGGSYKDKLLYTIATEFGSHGTTTNGLIKENYFQITLGLSYRDFLYTRGRRYD
ncbi:hypothetical protein [Pollutibacter soli]|uniref:hypothetical protein n=1 Tax=Pollutibacter soli TaxID=3034157 RepID=UPI003013BF2F